MVAWISFSPDGPVYVHIHHTGGEAIVNDYGVHLGCDRLTFKFLLQICQSRENHCAFEHLRAKLQMSDN